MMFLHVYFYGFSWSYACLGKTDTLPLGNKDDNIQYVSYTSELQMPDIMKLIQKDLSEPYSIYTYRYFIHNWPKLCFLVCILTYKSIGNLKTECYLYVSLTLYTRERAINKIVNFRNHNEMEKENVGQLWLDSFILQV